jgi:hypothetical protein
MKPLIRFYAGPSRDLGKAFGDYDLERLGSLARAQADFSMNLQPFDIDLLSKLAYQLQGKPPIRAFGEAQAGCVGDNNAGSAYLLSTEWVATLAGFPRERLDELTETWMRAVAEEWKKAAPVTPEIAQAVRDLIALCQTARQDRLDVVLAWGFTRKGRLTRHCT